MNKSQYLLYAGRISKEKGVEDLIKSFINCNFKEVNLKIIGDGPLLKQLKILTVIKILNSNSLPNNKVLSLINDATAVVTATKLHEGQPTLLCEASAMGIPSIYLKKQWNFRIFPQRLQVFI